ncbi:accessory Sec system protein Asp2 [Lactobacillus sp. ESL0785]|uniref:accessory Sec system protein Asp2 n=1 Tax=Lactobacillus sp. ESL0785 TaxID=2983232 RepID=UPI0023F68ABD|nr:accessory Sec system protein Asp2 [Lactobacillus sp. ESL0785]WEV71432.1 accessory Sec system protein Asp2 [Lactobacillus sp. ESL0785]
MGPKKLPYLIHSGSNQFILPDNFFVNCNYLWANEDYLQENNLEQVFINGRFNASYQNNYFLLDKSSVWLKQPAILKQLPANRVIYSAQAKLTAESQAILDFRGEFRLDFGQNLTQLQHDINLYFFGQNIGYQVLPLEIYLPQPILECAKIMGNTYYEINYDFGTTWQNIGHLRHSVFLPQGMKEDIEVECQRSANVHFKVEVQCFSIQKQSCIKKWVMSDHDFHQKHLLVGDLGEASYFQVTFYAYGSGQLKLGTIHMHRALGPYGKIALGAKGICDRQGLGGEVNYLFNAGNLKPPLLVVFAGFNTASVFEGNGLVQKVGSPSLLVTDSRLYGGAFYIGSAEFEQQVGQIIIHYLHQLGFTRQDLVLTGISMGAYAALYYGAQLGAGSIVAAKIIANLGVVAANSKIKRPEGFDDINDIILAEYGGIDAATLAKVNQKMWLQFARADLSQTDFTLGYMEEEDYDDTGYQSVRNFLQKKYPQAHVLSKGFWGRHNDNAEISSWFIQQVMDLINYKYREQEMEG